jgi:acetyl esterase/lipase
MDNPPARPQFAADGTVRVPAFDLPPSEYSSAEARAMQAMRSLMPDAPITPGPDIAVVRQRLEDMLAPQVEQMRRLYPVEIEETKLGSVPCRAVTPQGKEFDEKRVLINLHGGAFSVCAGACAVLESIPVAVLGNFKVITVDYRMAPEWYHPAALEDVEAVYRMLLETHDAKSIGVFGCSAGGALTAQVAAWLPARGLPNPGAIGIFGAGGVRMESGDSAWIAAFIDGSFPPPGAAGDITRGYFTGADMRGPDVSPALHPEVVAKFPPSLIITGTRAMDMSPAIVTNSALIKAGVPSTLIVGEGMGHCYIYQSNLPEARDAHQAIADFFRRHLQ